MAGKLTIDDIARIAQVSKTTVSRVLNRKPDVDPETRERVLRIVAENHFVPRVTTSAQVSHRHPLIGILVPSFTWPMIPEIIKGAAEVLSQMPYDMVLYSLNDTNRDAGDGGLIDHILDTRLTAGILTVFPGGAIRHVLRLNRYGVPMVMIDDQDIPPALPWVGIDNQGGALTAVRHLIQLGHQRIAHIQGPPQTLCAYERTQGYRQALEEAGLPVQPEFILDGDFTRATASRLTHQLFTLPASRRPTAIFAANDQAAYGVIAAAEEVDLEIPNDMALVGFDDLTISAHVRPSLTTVRQPFQEMGRRGIELLLAQLGVGINVPSEGELVISDDPLRIQLPTSFVVRNSCGAARQDLSFDNLKSYR
jgi:LacI family transcriptional regulator